MAAVAADAAGSQLQPTFPEQHNGGAEPSLLELKDGRVWMTIRTQNGWLYESFSDDGIRWTEPPADGLPRIRIARVGRAFAFG